MPSGADSAGSCSWGAKPDFLTVSEDKKLRSVALNTVKPHYFNTENFFVCDASYENRRLVSARNPAAAERIQYQRWISYMPSEQTESESTLATREMSKVVKTAALANPAGQGAVTTEDANTSSSTEDPFGLSSLFIERVFEELDDATLDSVGLALLESKEWRDVPSVGARSFEESQEISPVEEWPLTSSGVDVGKATADQVRVEVGNLSTD